MAEAAEQFHRLAGTVHFVQDSLASLRSGAVPVRFAHQPNLLPYLGVLGQFTHIYLLASFAAPLTARSAVPAYFVMDYDRGSGGRFANSLLPDPQAGNGATKLTYKIDRSARNRVAFSLEAPPPVVLSQWRASFASWTRRYSVAANNVGANFPHPAVDGLGSAYDALHVLDECYLETGRFAMGNAVFLSVVVNKLWGLPVVFIPLSFCARSLQSPLLLLARYLARVAPQKPFQIWKVCPTCCSRNAVSANAEASNNQCTECGTPFRAPSRFPSQAGNCESPCRPLPFIPRVLADNLADYEIYGVPGGTTYQSSIPHLVESRGYLPPDRPPGIELGLQFFYNTDMHAQKKPYSDSLSFHAQELLRSGRASMLYYLSMFGYSGLKDQLLAVSTASMCTDHAGGEH